MTLPAYKTQVRALQGTAELPPLHHVLPLLVVLVKRAAHAGWHGNMPSNAPAAIVVATLDS
ncbi:hypothetical protein NWF32_22540 [Pseudomonas qingdaonensis]|nr:hypothetical protein [Pseudomonas qingdaonensis]